MAYYLKLSAFQRQVSEFGILKHYYKGLVNVKTLKNQLFLKSQN